MKILSSIRAFLRGGTPGFNRFESVVLNAVARNLSADAQERLQQRLRTVNLVRRLDGGREINGYVMRGGRAVVDNTGRIDDSSGERVLANFRIDGPLGTANLGKVWLVDGRLFSIEFEDPTEHANAEAIASIQVTLERSQ